MAIQDLGEEVMSERIDAGTPFVHSLEEDVASATGAGKNGTATTEAKADPKIEALEKIVADLREENRLTREESRKWSERALNASRPAAAAEPEPTADPYEDEAPEVLLDDIAKEGLAALNKRGYIKKSDVEQMIRAEIDQTVEQVTTGSQFDQMLNTDFPELKDQNSELFIRTRKHFNDFVEMDPAARTAKTTLVAAARMARTEIAAEKAKNDTAGDERRQRIDAQRGTRTQSSENSGGDVRMSPTQASIVGHLGKFIGGKTTGDNIARVLSFSGEKAGKAARTGTNG